MHRTERAEGILLLLCLGRMKRGLLGKARSYTALTKQERGEKTAIACGTALNPLSLGSCRKRGTIHHPRHPPPLRHLPPLRHPRSPFDHKTRIEVSSRASAPPGLGENQQLGRGERCRGGLCAAGAAGFAQRLLGFPAAGCPLSSRCLTELRGAVCSTELPLIPSLHLFTASSSLLVLVPTFAMSVNSSFLALCFQGR